ncbi:hypothetical protein PMIN02_002015 [Paraphaeosphaeria minitans]|uniref:Uncharacterized protein n=1 Tax=Paraphaeosphaeria minitans TaxID=565426 RepID=A0A9P6G9U0_9PLEO|nr:hypothetical protein PMIN01_11344 [Paraphaeosphaeria minitans]
MTPFPPTEQQRPFTQPANPLSSDQPHFCHRLLFFTLHFRREPVALGDPSLLRAERAEHAERGKSTAVGIIAAFVLRRNIRVHVATSQSTLGVRARLRPACVAAPGIVT